MGLASRARGALRRLTGEPLWVFLLIGALLLTIDWIRHGPPRAAAGDRIEISQGRVLQIANGFKAVTGRMPDAVEIRHLVDDFSSEETSYREAIAMGLDGDDTIVRRRLRQKLEFLIEDAAAIAEPDEATLRQWLAAHPQRYLEPARRAIQQVVFSRDRRGAAALTDAGKALESLRAGADPATLGDPSMLPARTEVLPKPALAAIFGEGFAGQVFSSDEKAWFGPVASPYGQHLVRVIAVAAPRQAAFEKLRDKLREDWLEQRRSDARDVFQAGLRKRQAIRIDWPAPWQDLPAQADANPRTRSQRGSQVDE